jgi:hypothetical protein
MGTGAVARGLFPLTHAQTLQRHSLSTLGRPPSLVARKRRDQAVPSTRNRERSGEQRNVATLQRRGRAGRLRTSHERRQGTHAMREGTSGIPYYRTLSGGV